VGSIQDAEADAGKSASHACIPSTTKSAVGLSYLTGSLNELRLIQIASFLNKSTLCMEGVNFLLNLSSEFTVNGTIGPHSWICMCIADEKISDADADPGPLDLP
jgi:hypothetical protein